MNRREFLLSGTAALAFGGCRTATDFQPERSFALGPNGQLRIPVPGLAAPVRFLVAADTHLSLRDERDSAFAENCARMTAKTQPMKALPSLFDRARREKADLVLLAGDILSFPTLANVEHVRETLAAGGVPWMYTAGNHDWHFEGDEGSDLEQRARWIGRRLGGLYPVGANPLCHARTVGGVRFVAMDNSAYHILPEQLAFWREQVASGEPIVLFSHVPLWVKEWSVLMKGWGVLMCGNPTWGYDTDPFWKIERRQRWAVRQTPETFAFREEVLAAPNLVAAFSGHLHHLLVAQERGKCLFSVAANNAGNLLSVTLVDEKGAS